MRDRACIRTAATATGRAGSACIRAATTATVLAAQRRAAQVVFRVRASIRGFADAPPSA